MILTAPVVPGRIVAIEERERPPEGIIHAQTVTQQVNAAPGR
jgi:hypothetical protein